MNDPAIPNHRTSRRAFLGKLSAIPAAAGLSSWMDLPVGDVPISLPMKDAFDIKGTFLNSAYTHPMSKGSRHSIQRFLDERMQNGKAPGYDMAADRKTCMDQFAKMMNVDADELAWIPSTLVGENHIVNSLRIPGSGARVVTDAYHFEGSLFLYGELAKQGLDLTIIRPKNMGIDLDEMDAAITPGTKLVAVCSVSSINGFQHDLKELCRIAHAKGALVYADIIQGAGAVPMDFREIGLDFAACATYKWLMGDFGAGFLYVRKDRLPLLKRNQYGYRQIKAFNSHLFPFETPGTSIFDSTTKEDTGGHFEVGTLGNECVAGLTYSLGLLERIGISNIQRHRQPMIDRLQEELPKMGFVAMTPKGSTSPIVSFAFRDAEKQLAPKIEKAGVNIQLYEHRIRISPSFFNDMNDLDKLLRALY